MANALNKIINSSMLIDNFPNFPYDILDAELLLNEMETFAKSPSVNKPEEKTILPGTGIAGNISFLKISSYDGRRCPGDCQFGAAGQ